MASTVSATTLTSTITESLTLNGNTYGNAVTHTVATQGEAYSRTMSVATTETTLISFGSADASGAVVGDSVSYMRFTNLDDTNYVQLCFKTSGESAVNFSVKIGAGESYVCMNNQISAAASGTLTALQDVVSLTGKSNTAACDIELIIVSA
jgi:hypothetical protein